jgi:hypothetical protein
MAKRMIMVAAALAALVACDGDGPSGPPGSSAEGTYRGTHTFSFIFGAQTISLTCNGSVVVIDVVGQAVQGTMTIDATPPPDCPDLANTGPISGSLTSNGTLTFATPDQAEFGEQFEDEFPGCNVTRVDDAFIGTLRNGELRAEFTLAAVCQEEPTQVDFEWGIVMTKVT